MIKRIAADAFGEALELGKSIKKQASRLGPGQLTKTALEQVKGVDSSSSSVPPGLEDLKGKRPTSTQLAKMRHHDALKSRRELDATRIELRRVIIQRYQKLQQDVLREEKEREQRVLEKQREEIEALKEKEEKAKEKEGKGAALPKRKKKKGILGIFARQKKGSREMRLGKAG